MKSVNRRNFLILLCVFEFCKRNFSFKAVAKKLWMVKGVAKVTMVKGKRTMPAKIFASVLLTLNWWIGVCIMLVASWHEIKKRVNIFNAHKWPLNVYNAYYIAWLSCSSPLIYFECNIIYLTTLISLFGHIEFEQTRDSLPALLTLII